MNNGKTYAIRNDETGLLMGTFDAVNEMAALDALARDLGYSDYAEACREAPLGAEACREAPLGAEESAFSLTFGARGEVRYETTLSEALELLAQLGALVGPAPAQPARDLLPGAARTLACFWEAFDAAAERHDPARCPLAVAEAIVFAGEVLGRERVMAEVKRFFEVAAAQKRHDAAALAFCAVVVRDGALSPAAASAAIRLDAAKRALTEALAAHNAIASAAAEEGE